MKARLLPLRADMPELDGTLLDPAYKSLSPASDRIIAVEEDGRVIGCSALMAIYHLEGTWVAPEYRGTVAVGRHLVRAQRQLLKAMHVESVYMMARTPETSAMVRKFGTFMQHLDCEHYIVKVS